ncbi:hypothetical protein OHT17_50970 [Streptomyces sp. NBC_00371]|uniref:hypothetical protein n=1 Tax=Streptomyces sp. NBC_00371 TaxID=2975729 RepID=UPI002E25381A
MSDATANGPDLPDPREPMTVEAVLTRWPTGAWKRELIDGVIYFYGEFDQRDIEIAQRTYPGRRVLVNRAKDLEVHPGGASPARSVLDSS